MPVDLRNEAASNLRFIREMMERTERVSTLSGVGGMVMGGIAFAAMAIASTIGDLAGQLTVWIGAAFSSVLAGAAASVHKARRLGASMTNDAARRFMTCLIPTLLVGAVLTLLLWETPQTHLLPALWMLLYGCGVLAAGTYAVTPIMHMGFCLLAVGMLMTALPRGWENIGLGLGFGGLHTLFGWQVYRHHGG